MPDDFDIGGFTKALGTSSAPTGPEPTRPKQTKNYVSDELLNSLRRVESGTDPYAVNKETKAMGPYQFMPDTASMLHRQGVKFNPFDEEQSREAARHYLNTLIEKNGGDVNKALAQYGGFITKDPSKYVGNVLGGQQAPQQTQQQAPQSGDFDLGGFDKALSTETTPEQLKTQLTQKQTNVQPATKEGKSLTAKEKSNLQLKQMFGENETLGSFGAGLGRNISTGVGALQQLVGKGVEQFAPETGQAIQANALQNIQKAKEQTQADIERNPNAAMAGEMTGFVVNPVNKLIPGFGGPAQSVLGGVVKGAGQGAVANVLTTPVLDEIKPFITQKLEQGAVGAAFGGAFGGALKVATSAIGSGLEKISQVGGKILPPEQATTTATNLIKQSGIDQTKVTPSFYNGLVEQAKQALQTGNLNQFKAYAKNASDFESLPIKVPYLKGQVTRDPMQYAIEQNLRGIEGVGEPIQAIMKQANTAMLQNLDAFGAKNAQPIVDSGNFLRNTLRNADEIDATKVREAYQRFKDSTGKDIEVPLSGLAQDYARVIKDYGRSTLPEGVRNNLESLGLIKGKQLKVTTIEDAENLIKNINQNYDKTKPVQVNALDQLRRSVENTIREAGANLPGEAGAVAREARQVASERFKTIEGIPALRDALKGKEPDKFVQNHILQGNVNEITKMVNYLEKNSPETLAQLRNDVLGVIKNRVTNNVSEANAQFSQAGLKHFIADGSASLSRLERFLSPEQINGLKALNRVAENIYVEPVASAVNKSNTSAAAANLVKKTINAGALNDLLGYAAGVKFPVIGGLISAGGKALQQSSQASKASGLVEQAINPQALLPTTPLNMLGKPGALGAGAAKSIIEQRNREYEQQNR
jgi:hypothetical protein